MVRRPIAEDIQIEGVIELAATDLDGSALAVQIRDSQGNSYLIDDNSNGDSLLRCIGLNVNVSGVSIREGGLSLVTVESFFLAASPKLNQNREFTFSRK